MRTLLTAWLFALAFASSASAATYYVAPAGNDAAAGSKAAPWKSIAKAQDAAAPGDTLYFRGGTYAFSDAVAPCASRTSSVDAVLLSKSGRAGAPIRYFAYPGETPVFDFSKMRNDCRIKGFHVSGDYIHLKGLEVTGVQQNNNLNHESWGVWIEGSHNIFERLNLHHNMGPGLFIAEGGYNLVLNSDSHRNFDPLTSNGAGESADGFGAHSKMTGEGNVFRGCRAWMNADDGFDLINTYFPVLIENSWAWQNGYLPDSMTPIGNGNGFKMGGFGGRYSDRGVKHTLRYSVAFNNKQAGINANYHTVPNDYFNNTSFNNGADYNMLGMNAAGKYVNLGNLKNNVTFGPNPFKNMPEADSAGMAGNAWSLPVTVTEADFQAVSMTGWDAPRQADGSLPVLPLMRLAAGSDLIDKGADVGLAYKGRAPTSAPSSDRRRHDPHAEDRLRLRRGLPLVRRRPLRPDARAAAVDQGGRRRPDHLPALRAQSADGAGGENIVEHIGKKYGSTPQQSAENRAMIRERAAAAGFEMNMTDQSRIWNTFDAHRLIHWAGEVGPRQQRRLKEALLGAHFTHNQPLNDDQVLVDAAVAAGLDADEARAVLTSDRYAAEVREAEELWRARGITSVPAVVVNDKYLISGGQPPEAFEEALRNIAAEMSA